MSRNNPRTNRTPLIQLAVRLSGGAFLLYLAWPEIGPWTAVVLTLLFLGTEGNAYINTKILEVLRERQ